MRPAQSNTGSLLSRRLASPSTARPRTHLLSNTRYHVMVTNAGSGYSQFQGLDCYALARGCDLRRLGPVLLHSRPSVGVFWSAGHQPVCRPADEYEVVFSADRATFRRRDGDIETLLEITVSPEQPAEVRRVTLINRGSRPRELELTSYLEPVLGDHGSDLLHPAFDKLFLETEHVSGSDSLLCRRRPRSSHECPIWGVHVIAVDRSASGSSIVGDLQYETDRASFVGAGEPWLTRPPSDRALPSRERSARSSTRSSASAGGSSYHPEDLRLSDSLWAWPSLAMPPWP